MSVGPSALYLVESVNCFLFFVTPILPSSPAFGILTQKLYDINRYAIHMSILCEGHECQLLSFFL